MDKLVTFWCDECRDVERKYQSEFRANGHIGFQACTSCEAMFCDKCMEEHSC